MSHTLSLNVSQVKIYTVSMYRLNRTAFRVYYLADSTFDRWATAVDYINQILRKRWVDMIRQIQKGTISLTGVIHMDISECKNNGTSFLTYFC